MDFEKIKANSRIFILTGAGISAESGLSTFRDKDGIWSKYHIEDVATPEAFARQPSKVHEFYNMRRNLHRSPEIKPNPAHYALARLEAEWPGDVLLVTQNVDNLHARAGNYNLIPMHGEMQKIRCDDCGGIMHWSKDLSINVPCPSCGTAGRLRPHVVWFGETPLELERTCEYLVQCDLFLSIGTSGTVYPAAGFLDLLRQAGKKSALSVSFNLENEQSGHLFNHHIVGQATQTVPQFVDRLLR